MSVLCLICSPCTETTCCFRWGTALPVLSVINCTVTFLLYFKKRTPPCYNLTFSFASTSAFCLVFASLEVEYSTPRGWEETPQDIFMHTWVTSFHLPIGGSTDPDPSLSEQKAEEDDDKQLLEHVWVRYSPEKCPEIKGCGRYFCWEKVSLSSISA